MHIPIFLQQSLGDPAIKVNGYSLTTAYSFIPFHRISFRSWEPIYFLISKQYLRKRPKHVPSSVQQSICSLLAWMIWHIILCSSSTSLYINTRPSKSTTQLMTCSTEPILSSWKGLVATSCYWQIIPVVQTHQICTTLSIQECWVTWVFIMPMWSIPDLGCRTLRLTSSKCYGSDGMGLLIQGLQDGIVQHWTCCTSHPYNKTIPLPLWIQKLYYEGVISSQPLTRKKKHPTLTSHALQNITRTTCYTMLVGKFNYFLWVWHWPRLEPQVFQPGSTYAVSFWVRSQSPSCSVWRSGYGTTKRLLTRPDWTAVWFFFLVQSTDFWESKNRKRAGLTNWFKPV